jgi:hypothetical protein
VAHLEALRLAGLGTEQVQGPQHQVALVRLPTRSHKLKTFTDWKEESGDVKRIMVGTREVQ